MRNNKLNFWLKKCDKLNVIKSDKLSSRPIDEVEQPRSLSFIILDLTSIVIVFLTLFFTSLLLSCLGGIVRLKKN